MLNKPFHQRRWIEEETLDVQDGYAVIEVSESSRSDENIDPELRRPVKKSKKMSTGGKPFKGEEFWARIDRRLATFLEGSDKKMDSAFARK